MPLKNVNQANKLSSIKAFNLKGILFFCRQPSLEFTEILMDFVT
jgi:hypothetical protein